MPLLRKKLTGSGLSGSPRKCVEAIVQGITEPPCEVASCRFSCLHGLDDPGLDEKAIRSAFVVSSLHARFTPWDRLSQCIPAHGRCSSRLGKCISVLSVRFPTNALEQSIRNAERWRELKAADQRHTLGCTLCPDATGRWSRVCRLFTKER